MSVKRAVERRLQEVCAEKQFTVNALANMAGVTPSTIYSILDPARKDVGIVVIKKLCDGLEMSLEEFFSGEAFSALEQEIM